MCSSDLRSVSYYHWWPAKDQWEWIQYDFEKPHTISSSMIYWFDDGPDGGCRIPDAWEMLYLSDNIWKPVRPRTKYTVTKNGWDTLNFSPVRVSSVKIKVRLSRDFSAGVYEWIVR